MTEFLEMGGYARWVWSAYGFAFLVVLVMIGASVASVRRHRRRLEAVESIAPGGDGLER